MSQEHEQANNSREPARAAKPIGGRSAEELEAGREYLRHHPSINFDKFLNPPPFEEMMRDFERMERAKRRVNKYRDEYDELSPEEFQFQLGHFRERIMAGVAMGEWSYLKGVGLIMTEIAHRRVIRRPRKLFQRIADNVADDIDVISSRFGGLLRREQSRG